MNPTREVIIQRLMHQPSLSFNQLWDKQGESNRFAYHLKVLEEDGLVEKFDEKYSLSHEGKKYATYLEGISGKRSKAPLIGVIVVVYDEAKDQFLMLRRTKEPFFGVWGFHGGKLKFDQYILEAAAAELREESGLTCDLELKGLLSTKTFNNGELSYSHQMFMVKATNPTGELITTTREGENRWVKREEIASLETFPNVENSVQTVLGEKFRWCEADRMQKDDRFVDMKVIQLKEF